MTLLAENPAGLCYSSALYPSSLGRLQRQPHDTFACLLGHLSASRVSRPGFRLRWWSHEGIPPSLACCNS